MHQRHGAHPRAFNVLGARIAALGVLGLLCLGVPAQAFAAGQAAVAVYRCSQNKFLFDGNNDASVDLAVTYPSGPFPCQDGSSAFGLLGDLMGTGQPVPVTYLSGVWSVDQNRDGVADVVFTFGGQPGDVPLFGDMNGTGKDVPVIFRAGTWLVGSAALDGSVTKTYSFGQAGDIPLLADMDGDGVLDLVVYRNGTWLVSTKRDAAGGPVVDMTFHFGTVTGEGGYSADIPLAFDYNGDGVVDLVIYRHGTWFVSTRRNWFVDGIFMYGGAPDDVPLYAGRGAIPNARLDAARFLHQASFGPTPAEINNVMAMGYAAWIDNQFAKPETYLPYFVPAPDSQPLNCTSPLTTGGPADPYGTNCPRDVYGMYQVQRFFFVNALTAPDQLRQRVGWALSQILVTSSNQDPIAYANRNYQQMLIDNAFGNFRDLLLLISIDPFMGNYLDMVNNAKAAGTQQPNENYAREIMQLFSIGTLELNADGTLLLDLSGNPIQTYDQTDITELAKVMTGWTYPPAGAAALKWNMPINYASTMVPCEGAAYGCNAPSTYDYHETSIKTFLQQTIPPMPAPSAYTDLQMALDVIFNHPNVAPFIGKQLIQHLVTSNPSPAYVARVSAVFANNGSGVRGDLKAVVKAILLDPEARQPRNPIGAFGKLKEPVTLITNFMRQMNACCGGFSDGIDLATRSRAMAQDVYTSPTVFNYYPADYAIPGTDLAGPQFGIYDPTSLFEGARTIYNLTLGANCPAAGNVNLCGSNADATTVGATGTKIDWSSLAALAATPATLVDQVSDILLYGKLPPGLRQQVINGVSGVAVSTPPTAAQLRDRARTAAYLIATSPRYQVEY